MFQKWKIEIPDKLNVALKCSGELWQDGGKPEMQVEADLKWEIALTELEQKQLAEAGQIAKKVDVKVVTESKNTLWPDHSRHPGGIKIDVKTPTSRGEIEVTLTRWVEGFSFVRGGTASGKYMKNVLTCDGTGLDLGEGKTIFEEGMSKAERRGNHALAPTDMSSTVSLGRCEERGGAETICDLKVVTKTEW